MEKLLSNAQAEHLFLLRTETPPALAHLPPEDMENLRAVAEHNLRTGSYKKKLKELKGFDTRCHLTLEGALNTLIFHCYGLENKKSVLEELDIFPYAEVRTTGDAETCGYCADRDGKVYHSHEVDWPPFAACTCPKGCRCQVVGLMADELKH